MRKAQTEGLNIGYYLTTGFPAALVHHRAVLPGHDRRHGAGLSAAQDLRGEHDDPGSAPARAGKNGGLRGRQRHREPHQHPLPAGFEPQQPRAGDRPVQALLGPQFRQHADGGQARKPSQADQGGGGPCRQGEGGAQTRFPSSTGTPTRRPPCGWPTGWPPFSSTKTSSRARAWPSAPATFWTPSSSPCASAWRSRSSC